MTHSWAFFFLLSFTLLPFTVPALIQFTLDISIVDQLKAFANYGKLNQIKKGVTGLTTSELTWNCISQSFSSGGGLSLVGIMLLGVFRSPSDEDVGVDVSCKDRNT